MSFITNASQAGVKCEAKGCTSPFATHVYGPECEATTGELMYLCRAHAEMIELWRTMHMNEPVECTKHGRIGTVRSSLILKEM